MTKLQVPEIQRQTVKEREKTRHNKILLKKHMTLLSSVLTAVDADKALLKALCVVCPGQWRPPQTGKRRHTVTSDRAARDALRAISVTDELE